MSKLLLKITGILEIVLAISLFVMSFYTLGNSESAAMLLAPHDTVAKLISISIILFPIIRICFGLLGFFGKSPSLLVLGGFIMLFTSFPILGPEKPIVYLYIYSALISLIFLISALLYNPKKYRNDG